VLLVAGAFFRENFRRHPHPNGAGSIALRLAGALHSTNAESLTAGICPLTMPMLTQIVIDSNDSSTRVTSQAQVDAGSPGAGRAKLRLSRGFPRRLA
jgi:hypothetical protein